MKPRTDAPFPVAHAECAHNLLVQIVWCEVAHELKPIRVENPNFPCFPGNQPPVSHLLERPVDVHSGNAGCIRHILLRERKIEAVVLDQSDRFKASRKFAEEMRNRRQRFSRGVTDPFAKDRGLDQCFPPENAREARRLGENAL